eukprot:CAMPEP_0203910916 /NCGR_PEP_ID=MMETSP0359-20131031/52142_1 /ASSEMBLY_ACC=CAM_ASM_000338 /TAXON_ID=268821 /ORGANISM="Scrippsiella Hangoei, Strain SHTV-5" /LENGTH=160 /DNA_ID=CAMNT_0050836503 /DNA_START=52 /DNA_END=534 /DNA_ORIENTATION=+
MTRRWNHIVSASIAPRTCGLAGPWRVDSLGRGELPSPFVSRSVDDSLQLSEVSSQSSVSSSSSVELPGKIDHSAARPDGQQMAGHQESPASQQSRRVLEVMSSVLPIQDRSQIGIRDLKWDDPVIVEIMRSDVGRAALGSTPPPLVSRPGGAQNGCCVMS